jgi:hypothetical protein
MLITALLLTLTASPNDEVSRVREHLRGASALLELRDVSGLTSNQQRLRRENAERLLAYTAAGRFPKNRLVPGLNPVFRDEEGTLCAVGALLWASGERALVEHIVATRNTATVAELADEPGLAEWLDAQGLTLAEAARIQPGYAFEAFQVTTPAHVVAAGACSPPIQLEPGPSVTADQKTNVSAWTTPGQLFPSSLQLFEGAQCNTLLVPSCSNCSLYLSVASTLSFRQAEPGQLTIRFSNGSGTITQVHEILLPDGGSVDAGRPEVDAGVTADAGVGAPVPTTGCGVTGGGSALLSALALLIAGRRFPRRRS